MKYTWKIGGEAGFGILTTGTLFARFVAQLGYHVFDYIEYPSLIRGGHNAYEIVFSDKKVRAFKSTVDCLICLNKETFDLHKHRLTKDSVVIYDPKDFTPDKGSVLCGVPFREILQKLQGQSVMKNTIAMGASLAVLGADLSLFISMLEKQFGAKGQKVVDINKTFAAEGYEYARKQFQNKTVSLIKTELSTQLVMTGNDAFSLASIIADCRFYSAYPMTPSSTVLTTLAGWQEKTGIVVRHAEDEISVINSALGASFGGVRASVGTSGGGFSLMVESLSFAGVAELPIVVFLAQRQGPATGLPTWTSQGDLLFAVHAGHGEFMKIILAPGDVEEMLELTTKAYNLSDIYQTPVIVLSDMLLSEAHETVSKQFVDDLNACYKLDRGKTVDKPTHLPYVRYKPESDGISERLLPGADGSYYQANSYEHKADSHTTESAEDTLEQVGKRHQKIQTYLANHFDPPTVYGDLDKSEAVLVSHGSNKRIILETIQELEKEGRSVTYIHFTHLYPLDEKKIKPLFENVKRYILVEQDLNAQFGKLLRMETGVHIAEQILRFDGRPITVEQIIAHINEKKAMSGVVEKLQKLQ